MSTRSWIVALVGAIITPYAFRLALVQAWMAHFVPDAPTANVTWAVIGAVISSVWLMTVAALTVRWSGARSHAGAVGAGAVAGLLAGGMTFAMFGAPAAGVAGAQAVYPYLAEPPPPPSLALLYDAILRTITWTYNMGWAMWLGGGFSGALVGVIVGANPAVNPPRASSPFAGRLMLLILSVLGCVGLIVSLAVFDALDQSLTGGMMALDPATGAPSHFARSAAVGSPLVVVLVLLLLLWNHGHRRHPQGAAEAWYQSWMFLTSGLIAILTVVFLLVVNWRAFLSLLGIGLVAISMLGVSLIALGVRDYRVSQTEEDAPMALPDIVALVVRGLAGGTFLVSLLQSLGMALWYNITLLIIPVIPRMAPTEGVSPALPPTTAYQLALSNYSVQMAWVVRARVLTWAGLVAAMLMVIAVIGIAERSQSGSRRKGAL